MQRIKQPLTSSVNPPFPQDAPPPTTSAEEHRRRERDVQSVPVPVIKSSVTSAPLVDPTVARYAGPGPPPLPSEPLPLATVSPWMLRLQLCGSL